MRRPLKVEAFAKLKEIETPIGSIIDVGILSGTSPLMSAFRSLKHLLIEPVVEWNDTIRQAYTNSRIDFELVNVAASNSDGVMNLELSTVVPGRPISHARLTEETEGERLRSVPVRTVDSLIAERSLPKPYLLKIDVDGAELMVIEGAQKTLPDCSVVVVEAGIKTFLERSTAIVNAGFQLFDIVDPCYYGGRFVQADFIFMNLKMLHEHRLSAYRDGFDIKNWEAYK